MNNYKKRLSAALIVCTFLIVNLISGNLFAQIVTNGSFENSNTGVVSGTNVKGWLIQVSDTIKAAPVFEIVSDSVEQGSRALKVAINGTGASQWDIQLVSDSLPVKQGRTYNYTVWAKSQKAGAQVNFTVGYYSTGEIKAIRPATLTTKWQKFTTQFTVSENQPYIRGPIHFSYAGNKGNTIYIDNLQILDVNVKIEPVVVQAESGKLGNNYSVLQNGVVKYIAPKADYAGLTSPGDTSRMATYQVTFPDSGTYNLFAHLRVGSNGFNDDSFFYGNGFGVKNDTSSADWVFVNGLNSAGFSDSVSVVDGPGMLGNGVWKWVNLTKNSYQGSSGVSFKVGLDNLTKTFQIGSHEDGLDIDKFAFGKSNLYFTVGWLDNELSGTTKNPSDSTKFWRGPALATGQGKFLGNVKSLTDNIYSNYWNQLTPGNEGKWGSVAGVQDTTKWDWSGLDSLYNYAQSHHLIFKDHTLIWGQQQPSWISGLDSTQQAFYIETWIRMVGKRYPNMDMIDVVNEQMTGHNPPDGTGTNANYKKALGGNGTTGKDWVINAFKLARKYLPNTKLLINDYGIINDNAATIIYLQVINMLKDRGLIDGIGVQGHRFELETADTIKLKSNLDKLAATGLPIYISEFDLGNLNDSGTADDNMQLQLYKKIFPILWKHPGVKGITLWGYLENQMWQPTCFLVHADGSSRPAFNWLVQFLKDNPTDVNEKAFTLPSNFELMQNYPNPFNPTTNIKYNIIKTSKVTLKVFDLLGREIQSLVNTVQAPGQYIVTFNGGNLASGVYFYQLSAGDFSITKKLMLLK
jgi:endo-1,4-beta-xylanase